MPFGTPTLAGDLLLALVYEKPEAAVLKAMDLELKAIRWTRETPGGWSSARPYLWSESVLVGGQRGTLAAYSRAGTEEWLDTVGKVIRGIGFASDVLYVGTLSGAVYAYRPAKHHP